MVLKQCVAETTTERDSSKFKEAAEPMDDVSSVVVNSYLTKRKAEFDLEEEEQSVGENEEGSDEEAKMDEPEAKFDMLMAPEWDVDSFEALDGKTFREFWEEMVYVCLQKHNQVKDLNVELVEVVRGNFHGGPRSKSYITFMAREKPDGPLVEYQAKSMLTLDGKIHPILCRPSPMPKP
ncbi:unnamed protein product [Arabidopsis arenosa]|uniref:Uncharacterized protein n=1 Tax=Arabidopsis arenosa TaxID=38785 RepID=A0A8S2AUF2_ARAAE|nr:unnamed protein product [Arabidopsis arenosa]